MSALTTALNYFRTNEETITYDILRVDANGVGQGYSIGGWDWDTANKVKADMEQAPWNEGMTLHLVKKSATVTYELV